MKTLIAASILASTFAAPAVFAVEGEVEKICITTFAIPGADSISTTITIKKAKIGLVASVDQKKGLQTRNYDESVAVFDQPVRANLNGTFKDDENLNKAEMLINHAMALTTDPAMKGIANSGIDLSQVRSAKVYVIGEETGMGSASIVEAKDQAGKLLGSFVGGFLVSPCE